MSKVNEFRQQLEDAVDWEDRVKPKLRDQVVGWSVEQIKFTDDPESQLAGIDQVLSKKDDLNVDVKIRSNTYYQKPLDIALEETSIVEENKPGWVYNEETDIIAYAWKNKVGDNLVDGVLLLLNQDFVDWFEDHKAEYPTYQAESYDQYSGEKWHTDNVVVPIEELPNEFVRTEFEPELPVDKITEQSKLTPDNSDFCFHEEQEGECPVCGCEISSTTKLGSDICPECEAIFDDYLVVCPRCDYEIEVIADD